MKFKFEKIYYSNLYPYSNYSNVYSQLFNIIVIRILIVIIAMCILNYLIL